MIACGFQVLSPSGIRSAEVGPPWKTKSLGNLLRGEFTIGTELVRPYQVLWRVTTRWHCYSTRKGFLWTVSKVCQSARHCLLNRIDRILLGSVPKQTTMCIQNVTSEILVFLEHML